MQQSPRYFNRQKKIFNRRKSREIKNMGEESIMEKKKRSLSWFVRDSLSQGYRGTHTLTLMTDIHAVMIISRVSRGIMYVQINPITWLPHRDEIFILRGPTAAEPCRAAPQTTTAPIDSAIYQLILSTRPRRCARNEFPL